MKIVTHSGSWHADEVLAIALLAVVLKKVPEVTRTRDPKVIQEALQDKNTYVLDVGGQYHPLHKNFDHHQRGFDYRNHKGNKLSTFGLVVKYLSRASSETAATSVRGYFTDAVYESLLEFSDLVDKHDNGIERNPELLWISDMNALEDFPLVLSMADSWLEAKILLWEREEEEEAYDQGLSLQQSEEIERKVKRSFQVGQIYLASDIKKTFDKLGFEKPKGTTLSRWFHIKKTTKNGSVAYKVLVPLDCFELD